MLTEGIAAYLEVRAGLCCAVLWGDIGSHSITAFCLPSIAFGISRIFSSYLQNIFLKNIGSLFGSVG
jgi:hypothetical protein